MVDRSYDRSATAIRAHVFFTHFVVYCLSVLLPLMSNALLIFFSFLLSFLQLLILRSFNYIANLMLNICHQRHVVARALSSPAFSWLFLMFLIIFWLLLLLITILPIFVHSTYTHTHTCTLIRSIFKLIFDDCIQYKSTENQLGKNGRKSYCAIFKYE